MGPKYGKYLQLEKTSYLVLGSVLHLDTVVVPRDLGQGVGHDGAVEHEGVAAVLLPDRGLLREGGGRAVNLRLGGRVRSCNREHYFRYIEYHFINYVDLHNFDTVILLESKYYA